MRRATGHALGRKESAQGTLGSCSSQPNKALMPNLPDCALAPSPQPEHLGGSLQNLLHISSLLNA